MGTSLSWCLSSWGPVIWQHYLGQPHDGHQWPIFLPISHIKVSAAWIYWKHQKEESRASVTSSVYLTAEGRLIWRDCPGWILFQIAIPLRAWALERPQIVTGLTSFLELWLLSYEFYFYYVMAFFKNMIVEHQCKVCLNFHGTFQNTSISVRINL